MDKYLICFLLTFFLPNIYGVGEWKLFPFAWPCDVGLCVPRAEYNCPCWRKQYFCKPETYSCCEDPNFFPTEGPNRWTCVNKTDN